jgi:hypothetical protein
MKIDSAPRGLQRALAGLLLALACLPPAPAQAADAKLELPPFASDGKQRVGKFIWADLVTDDAVAARAFYSSLFGWTFEEHGDFSLASKGGQNVAGIIKRPRPTDRPGQPRWVCYLSVADIEVAQKTILVMGGKVMIAPRAIPKRGEQAIFADAEGAVFGIVKSSSGDPQDFLADPGEWIWIQLLSRDARKATEFYRTLAGYEVTDYTQARRALSFMLGSAGVMRAAVGTIPADHPEVSPTWLPFLRVENLDETLAKARQGGGKVLLEPAREFYGHPLAIIADPTGGAVGILQWKTETQAGAGAP